MEWGFTYIAIYVVCIKMSTPCIALMLLQIIVSNWKEGQRNIITHCCLHLVLHYKCNKQNTKFYLYNMSLSLCCDIWRKFKLRLSITEEKGQWGCFSTSSDGSAQLSTMTKTIRIMRRRHENMSQDPKKNYSESKLMNALFARYINVILLLTNENIIIIYYI